MQDMDAVYRQHFRMVYQYLMSLTHQPDVAEELAQETFCQAVSSIHRYDGSCKITTWLCAIAKNQYLSYLRKHPLHEDLTDTEAELPHTPSAEQEDVMFATAHEDKDVSGKESDGFLKTEHKNMDLHNNEVGRILAMQNPGLTEDAVANLIYSEVNKEKSSFIWLHE